MGPLSESNSSSVDNVFDMYIHSAKEVCEKHELAALDTSSGSSLVSLAGSDTAISGLLKSKLAWCYKLLQRAAGKSASKSKKTSRHTKKAALQSILPQSFARAAAAVRSCRD